jgi:hypothetical protein
VLQAAALLSVPALAASVDATQDAKKAIQQAYDLGNAAMVRRDSAGTLKYYAPHWTSVGANGQIMTLAQFKSTLDNMLTKAHNVKATSQITKIRLRGNEADVTVNDYMQASLVRPPGSPSAGSAPSVLTVVLTDTGNETWVKSGKGWLRLRSHIISGHRTLNGKPFPGDK